MNSTRTTRLLRMTSLLCVVMLLVGLVAASTALAVTTGNGDNPFQLKLRASDLLLDIYPTGNSKVDTKLRHAMCLITETCDAMYWKDGEVDKLCPRRAKRFFKKEARAARFLLEILKRRDIPAEVSARVHAALEALYAADWALADAAQEEAIATSANQDDIERSLRATLKAEMHAAIGNYCAAIKDCKKAWVCATKWMR